MRNLKGRMLSVGVASRRAALLAGLALAAVVVTMFLIPSRGSSAVDSVPCAKHINVVFLFYQGFFQPAAGVANGCWAFTKPRQDTDSGAFIICHLDGSQYGVDSATNFIFDDTNPANSWSAESNQLNGQCGDTNALRYGEAMAARNAQWCVDYTWVQPCWRRNTTGNNAQRGSIMHWAELYGADESISIEGTRKANWLNTANPSGAYRNNSRPVINVRADAGNATKMRSDVMWVCSVTGDTQYLVLYAGAAPPTVTSTDRSTIFQALNDCTV